MLYVYGKNSPYKWIVLHACVEKIVEPSQKKSVYYHRRYRRVPTIDECTVNDPLCYFEANEQFKRDR